MRASPAADFVGPDAILERERRTAHPGEADTGQERLAEQDGRAIGNARLGDDKRVLAAVLAGHERAAGHAGVIAGSGGLEVRQESRVVDMAKGIGVDEADLDGMLVAELAAGRL